MEVSAYVGELIAGLIYLVAGVRLYRLGRRSGQSPERLLSATFVLWSLSYLLWDVPYLLWGEDANLAPLFFASRVTGHLGTVALALVVRSVFRPRGRWAGGLVAALAGCLLLGLVGSAAIGDWEGDNPLANPWYWAEWLGYTAPLAWMALEGFHQHRRARQRLRLGLCDPLVCNRYLLWGLAGALWVATELVVANVDIVVEVTQRWSPLDFVLGLLEVVSVAVIWLVFFPPAIYRRWISDASAASPGVAA